MPCWIPNSFFANYINNTGTLKLLLIAFDMMMKYITIRWYSFSRKILI